MSQIDVHPTAVVAAGARLGAGVTVGPYAVIEEPVEIGAGAAIGPHAVIRSWTRIGAGTRVHPHAVIGDLPQDVTFAGEETWVEIGDETILREGVTVHRATRTDRPTRVGSGCFLMAYSHVAHDCQVGDGVILTNNVALGGHVEVGDRAIVGGGSVVHQFVRIGTLTMLGGISGAGQDLLPYSMVSGIPGRHYRLNTVGLRRAGITGDRYRAVEAAFRALRAKEDLTALPDTPELALLRAWLAAPSKRGLAGFLKKGEEAGHDYRS